jgi:glycosyltransferase involved in cell wall biosynthesis
MKIDLPNVTVVIPMYNAERWIGATLESVFEQTYPHSNIEVIVVDDGSQDEGANIARSLLDQHDVRGKVIALEHNVGLGAARNVGWRAASSEWIQFLDADDLLAPHKLELQCQRAAEAPESVVVIYSPWQRFAWRDERWLPVGDVNAPFVDADPVLQILHEFEFGYVGPTLVRRSFLEPIGGVREGPCLGEDIDMMLRIAMAGGEFRQADSFQPTFFYRDTPNSLWRFQVKHLESLRVHYSWLQNVEAHLRAGYAGGLPEVGREALVRRYSRFLDFLHQYDHDLFQEIVQRVRRLGVSIPPSASRSIRLLSRLVGYQNAMLLRSWYRDAGSMRRGLSAFPVVYLWLERARPA